MLTNADVEAILHDISYKDWLPQFAVSGNGWLCSWEFVANDSTTGKPMGVQRSRKWYVSPHSTKSEVVQTMLLAALVAEEHETREQFRYLGNTVFGPHMNVDVLHTVADKLDVRPPT